MQRKLNEEFIKQYSRQFSEKITSGFFAEKEHITGKEILNISPSRQVNFFVLKILFGNWQEEMKKLESPYFNYRDPDVRRAMVDFMNILSQKIQIDEDHFYELVEEAVSDTLKLAVLPQMFLYDELIQKDIDRINEKVTRPLLKYLKLHKEYFEKFFQENSGEELDVFLDRSREFFEGVDVKETVEEELKKLSEVHQVQFEDLLEAEEKLPEEEDDFDSLGPDFAAMEDDDEDEEDDEGIEAVSETGTEETEPDEISASVSTEDQPQEEDPDEDSKNPADDSDNFNPAGGVEDEEQVNIDESSESENIFHSELENTFGNDADRELSEELSVESGYDDTNAGEEPGPEEQDEIQEKIEEVSGEPSFEDESDEEPLNEKFSGEKSTINDRYANEEKFTVADKLEEKKVEAIMEAISVNHRYMFTKELFDGDRDEFNTAISKIEQCHSFDETVEMLVQDYAKERSWDMNSDEVKELLKIVFRRFR